MAAGKCGVTTTETLNWQAEFRDASREALYRRAMQRHDACHMRYALWIVAGLFLAFGLTDFSLQGFSVTSLPLLAICISVVLTCVMLAVALKKRPALAQHHLPINLVCLLGISGLLLSIPLRPDPTGLHLVWMVVASMALYLFLPNRLPWMLASNAYLLAGSVTAMLLWAPPPGGVLAISLLLGFVNLLGWMTVTRLNRLQREQFASLLEEREANRRLEAEIRERGQLEKQLRDMASTDSLTGIANRRCFFELADQELRRSRRNGTPLTLCMVDIDHFKSINDKHGHATGDQALRAVAACCQVVLRQSDIVARYGGEEFVIALPLATLDIAAMIGERLRHEVMEIPLFGMPSPPRLSITVGVSHVEDGETSLEPALVRADRALYEGKARGRNCVVVAHHGPPLSAAKG